MVLGVAQERGAASSCCYASAWQAARRARRAWLELGLNFDPGIRARVIKYR